MLTASEKLGIVLGEIQSRVSKTFTKFAKAQRKLPQVLQTLVTHGCITPEQKQAAATFLRDPEMTLNFLEAVARHRSPLALANALGTPVPQVKQASATPVGSSPLDWDEKDGNQFRNRILSLWGGR